MYLLHLEFLLLLLLLYFLTPYIIEVKFIVFLFLVSLFYFFLTLFFTTLLFFNPFSTLMSELRPGLVLRNVFRQDDIALNYRDPEGDLIRILDDEDVQLMIREGRSQQGAVKRPVNQFPWELHVTLTSDLCVYGTEA